MSEELKVAVEKKATKKEAEITAIKISGIKDGHLIFRYNGSERNLRFRLVPEDDWQGKDEQRFSEKKFRSYKPPAFFKINK
jgi:hypothetical protein